MDNQDRENHQHIAINWQAIHCTRGITLLVCYFAMERVLLQWPKGYRQITINSLQKKQTGRISEITCILLCNLMIIAMVSLIN